MSSTPPRPEPRRGDWPYKSNTLKLENCPRRISTQQIHAGNSHAEDPGKIIIVQKQNNFLSLGNGYVCNHVWTGRGSAVGVVVMEPSHVPFHIFSR